MYCFKDASSIHGRVTLTHCPTPCFLPAPRLSVHAAHRDLFSPSVLRSTACCACPWTPYHSRSDGHLCCFQFWCVTAIIASVNILGRVSSSRRGCFYRADSKKRSEVPGYFQPWEHCSPSLRPQSLVSASLVKMALSNGRCRFYCYCWRSCYFMIPSPAHLPPTSSLELLV